MHFQPLEDITENLEQSASRNRNLALFNRLLSSAPSPTGFMGGALRRTSAQLHRLTRPASHDPSFSEGEEEREESMGRSVETAGSTPSGLGLDTTQSTTCSCGGLTSTCPPMSAVMIHQERGGDGRSEDEKAFKNGEEGKNAMRSVVPKIPPPTLQTSTGRQHQLAKTARQSLLLTLDQVKPHLDSLSATNRSVPDFFSFQLIGDKVMTPNVKAESGLSLLTVPSLEVSAFTENSERERMVAD